MVHTIIQLRGCNGSGKTTIVRKLLRRFRVARIWGQCSGRRRILGYRCRVRHIPHFVYIVGAYETPTGGCDGISPLTEIERLIEKFSKKGHVIFEGAMISTIAGRWIALAEKLKKHKFIFAVLDTPIEKCRLRIEKRQKRNKRANSKGERPFTTERAMQRFRGSMISSPKALRRAGLDVRKLNHKKAFRFVLKWLAET